MIVSLPVSSLARPADSARTQSPGSTPSSFTALQCSVRAMPQSSQVRPIESRWWSLSFSGLSYVVPSTVLGVNLTAPDWVCWGIGELPSAIPLLFPHAVCRLLSLCQPLWSFVCLSSSQVTASWHCCAEGWCLWTAVS